MDFGSLDELELALGADNALRFGRHDCRGPQLTCKEDEKDFRVLKKMGSSSLKGVSNFPALPQESGQNVDSATPVR